MSRLIRAGLAALSVATVLVAGSAAAQQQKLSFLAAEYSAATLPFWEKVVADFEAANPDIDVTLEVVGWNTIHDLTAQRIAAGTCPISSTRRPSGCRNGSTPERHPAARPRSHRSPTLQADFVPALFEKGAAYEGENWGLPIAAAARAILFNKALIEQAGLDPARADRDLGRLSQR